MIAHVSKWVLPVCRPPIREGAVLVADGRIRAVGPAAEILAGFSGPVRDHGSGALLPGLVNAHVHLEFSALAGRIPPQRYWPQWLEAALAACGSLTPAEVEAGIVRGIADLRDHGCVLAAEVSNTGVSLPYLEASSLDYHLFFECLGFDLLHLEELAAVFPFLAGPEADANPRISAAAHAPYSVSPALFRAIDRWNMERQRPQMVHLGESQAELDFLRQGDGFFRDLLRRRGRWVEGYQPSGTGPGAYLDSLNFLGPRTLAVHGVHLTPQECRLLAARGAWLVLCPRANVHTGAGCPPVDELLRTGVSLALGTDSLAGNQDLNLFGEMLWLKQHFPNYPADLWLRLGTQEGARALGRSRDYGALEPGRQAALAWVPFSGGKDFWEELFQAGAAGQCRLINSAED